MERIVWEDKKYSVGQEELDNQHKKIFELINQLSAQGQVDVDSELVSTVLEELLHYSEEHLRYEEEVLMQCSYEDFDAHRQQHWQYLEKISNLSVAAMAHENKVPDEIIMFLREWWTGHILSEDMKYRSALEKGKDKA